MAMQLGYTLMTEQSSPKHLVEYAVRAEELGFEFAVSSDHYFPWIDEMGHAPNAWVTLGAGAPGRGRPAHQPHRPDDLRDLPDHAVPAGRRGAAGGHARRPLGRPVHP